MRGKGYSDFVTGEGVSIRGSNSRSGCLDFVVSKSGNGDVSMLVVAALIPVGEFVRIFFRLEGGVIFLSSSIFDFFHWDVWFYAPFVN